MQPQDCSGRILKGGEMPKLDELVTAWNEEYDILGTEIRLKDLSPEEYEAEVGSLVLSLVEGDADLAIQILESPECEGGWMVGDPIQWINNNRR